MQMRQVYADVGLAGQGRIVLYHYVQEIVASDKIGDRPVQIKDVFVTMDFLVKLALYIDQTLREIGKTMKILNIEFIF